MLSNVLVRKCREKSTLAQRAFKIHTESFLLSFLFVSNVVLRKKLIYFSVFLGATHIGDYNMGFIYFHLLTLMFKEL